MTSFKKGEGGGCQPKAIFNEKGRQPKSDFWWQEGRGAPDCQSMWGAAMERRLLDDKSSQETKIQVDENHLLQRLKRKTCGRLKWGTKGRSYGRLNWGLRGVILGVHAGSSYRQIGNSPQIRWNLSKTRAAGWELVGACQGLKKASARKASWWEKVLKSLSGPCLSTYSGKFNLWAGLIQIWEYPLLELDSYLPHFSLWLFLLFAFIT